MVVKEMEEIILKGDIVRQYEVDEQYNFYKEALDRSRYLANINENLIYEIYKGVIKLDNSREFPADFNQSHRDAYLRLKLRGGSNNSHSTVTDPQNKVQVV